MSDLVISCWKCMDRKVKQVGDECRTCQHLAWKKAEHQLFKTSRQKGKWTTEGVHDSWRAPEWMIEEATRGGSLRELSWGWELRSATGQRRQLPRL